MLLLYIIQKSAKVISFGDMTKHIQLQIRTQTHNNLKMFVLLSCSKNITAYTIHNQTGKALQNLSQRTFSYTKMLIGRT